MNLKYLSILLVLAFVSIHAQAATNTITAWLFNPYEKEVTRNIAGKYFDYLAQEADVSINVRVENNTVELVSECDNNNADIVFSPVPIAERLTSHCGYTTIAVTRQPIYLFATIASNITDPAKITRVGLIRGTAAVQIANEELELINSDFDAVIYPDVFTLFGNRNSDKINGFAYPGVLHKVSPTFDKNWRKIHQFTQVGQVRIVVSPRLPTELTDKLSLIMLENNPIAVEVWQNKFGLGPFEKPLQ